MLIPNPAKHYPIYSAKVLLKDGRIGFVQGEAEAKMLYIPGDEKDIQAVEISMEESSHVVKLVALWTDGGWQDYNEGAFEKVVEAAKDTATKAMDDFETGDWQTPEEILDEPDTDTVKKSVEAGVEPEEKMEVRRDPMEIVKNRGPQKENKWRTSGK